MARQVGFTGISQATTQGEGVDDSGTSPELVEQTRQQIDPLFLEVIDVLNNHQNFLPMAFFSELLIRLRQIDREVDLLHLFFELSTTTGPAELTTVENATPGQKLCFLIKVTDDPEYDNSYTFSDPMFRFAGGGSQKTFDTDGGNVTHTACFIVDRAKRLREISHSVTSR